MEIKLLSSFFLGGGINPKILGRVITPRILRGRGVSNPPYLRHCLEPKKTWNIWFLRYFPIYRRKNVIMLWYLIINLVLEKKFRKKIPSCIFLHCLVWIWKIQIETFLIIKWVDKKIYFFTHSLIHWLMHWFMYALIRISLDLYILRSIYSSSIYTLIHICLDPYIPWSIYP